MILTIVVIAAALLGVFAVVSSWAVVAIERANPPKGRFIEVDGGRLHVVELGAADAPAVVLLHGASGNLGDMRVALGDVLAARYRVILIDRPGHGWSERHGGRADASPARQAALLHRALEKWTCGARSWSDIRGPARSRQPLRSTIRRLSPVWFCSLR